MRAEKWLNDVGCNVVIRDPFRSSNIEQPDAIGWRSGISILIECKASRSDFLADQKKIFRKNPGRGMGDWRFYMAPKGIIQVSDLPLWWGLLEVTEKTIKKTHGVPKGNCYWAPGKFIDVNKRAETIMMLSALRRMQIRGHLPEIYQGIPK